jgi:hypothetical protein
MDLPHKVKLAALVRDLASEFPQFRVQVVSEHGAVDFYGEIQARDGSGIPIGVALDGDQMCLSVGALRLDYFPVTDSRVAESHAAALRGLLRGTHRVVEFFYDSRKPHRAELQRLQDGRWQPCGTWSRVHVPSFRPTRERILTFANREH